MGAARGTAAGLTSEQREALDTRGVSIALSAGAGCGKTFVLTERFLAEIAPDARAMRSELSEVVAITFTERAAREMRERIRQKARERLLAASDQEEADFWLAIERQLDGARVSTIHAFCVSLLRSQAIDAGLDPRFAVFDEKQTRALQSAVVEDALRNLLAARRPAAMELVFHTGLAAAQDLLRQLLQKRHQLRLEAWRGLTADELLARWHEYFVTTYRPAKLREFREHISWRTVETIARGEAPSDSFLRARCEQLVELFDRIGATEEIESTLKQIRETAGVQRPKGVKKEVETTWSAEQYESFKNAAAELRKRIDASIKDRNRWQFVPDGARFSAELGVHLIALAEAVIGAYDAAKRAAAVLDFEDLLIRARDLLCGDDRAPLRRQVAEQIRLLLVDEFQDTDPVQVELVQALCDAALTAGKLFFVGDLKQSIYRFRGAQPEVFRTLRGSMPDAGRLPLTRNFRSQPEILAFVNALFCDELGPEYEPLVADRPQVTAPPAVEFLWVQAEQEPESDEAPAQPDKEMEAEWIARRLRGLLDAGERLVFDRDETGQPTTRPARPGDIALLFRAMTHVELYEAALRKYGIEYYVVGGHAFYAQQEVFDLVNLLRAVASRADDLSLAAALRSPFFSVADETLYWLAQHPDGLGAGLLACALPESYDAAERGKIRYAAATLAALREAKDRLPIAALVQEALRLTGYDALLTAEFLGERKLANLHKLIDQAREMDAAGIFHLGDYLAQLAEFTRQQPKEPPAATLAENADVVRLMTIHQSKGLEFPIVVVPDLNARHQGSHELLVCDPELGPLVKAKRDPGLVALEMYRVVNGEEERAERSRLLYVATTRAADYLILSGSIKDMESPSGPWTKLLARRFALATGELLAELPEDYARPQIKVTLSEPACVRPTSERPARPDWESITAAALRNAERAAAPIPRSVAPIEVDHAARRRFSFSKLSGALELAADEEPSSLESTDAVAYDALALGHLVHAAMEQYDFAGTESVASLIDLLAPRFVVQGAPEIALAKELLDRLTKAPVWQSLASAKSCYRELPFSLRWPIGAEEADAVTIDGVIDCLYQDADGQWHLLDYKTNRASADGVQRLAAHYEPQLVIYCLAIEQALGVAPASATLCFLQPGVAHTFPAGFQVRNPAAAAIDAAIATLRGLAMPARS